MRRPTSKAWRRMALCCAMGASCWAVVPPPGAVRLHGDRLSMNVRRMPLREALGQLTHAGVRVKVDPAIDARVTGAFENEDAEKALKILLDSFGYVLMWTVVEGPVGEIVKLDEVQVFRPGHREDVRPLPMPDDNIEIAFDPSGGPPFVKDILLLGVRPGTSVEAFRALIEPLGGMVIDSVPGLGIYRVRWPPGTNIPALAAQLAQHPIVARVEPDYVTRIPAPVSVSDASQGPGYRLPSSVSGPAVAVLDSGLAAGIDLGDAVVGRYDALNPARELTDPVGHGTQMALVAAGAVLPTGGGEGVPVLAVRAFDDNGYASSYSLIRSLMYASEQGAKVINMSWGTETPSAFLASAVSYAQSKGMVVVASVGNEPTGRPVYPAAYSGVVGVSALDADGGVWHNSNSGPFVTLSAPGTAFFPVGYNGPPGNYAGTSIASAYTARLLAQYMAANPDASSGDAVRALLAALSDRGDEGRDDRHGVGALDDAAIRRLLQSRP